MTKEEVKPDVSSAKGNQESDFSESGDITGDGGVIKEILVHGTQGWHKPENGDEVQMHYRGTLLDGTEFDSSYERNAPFTFKLGDGKVIKGWDVVGKTMKKGEKAKVTLKPEYAYGASGSPPKIPANATLVFDMELISWTSKRDVYGDGLVIKSEVEAGEGWERPGKLAEVTLGIVATGMDKDGKAELSELHSGETTFTVGSGQVPAAWETVVPDMKKNAILNLLCKPPYISGPGIDYVPAGTSCVRFRLTLVSWRKIEDIHGDGTLVKKVLQEGTGWERPNEGSDVTVDLKYLLPSSGSKLLVPPPLGDPITAVEGLKFKVGDGDVIDGLDRVVQSMKQSESAMIVVTPDHGFATAPNLITEELAAGGVTMSSTVLIELTVVAFEKSKDVWSMSFEEKLEEMDIRKSKGNELFKAGRYAAAKKSYDRAVAFFDSPTSELSSELKSQVNELLVKCHINSAVCLDRMGETQKVLTHCKKALEIAPSNVKALYRQGCAYLDLEDYENASRSLKYALERNPGDVNVRRKLKDLKSRRVSQDAKERKLFSNMFDRMNKLENMEKSGAETNGIAGAEENPNEKGPDDIEMKDSAPEEVKAD